MSLYEQSKGAALAYAEIKGIPLVEREGRILLTPVIVASDPDAAKMVKVYDKCWCYLPYEDVWELKDPGEHSAPRGRVEPDYSDCG